MSLNKRGKTQSSKILPNTSSSKKSAKKSETKITKELSDLSSQSVDNDEISEIVGSIKGNFLSFRT